MSFRRARTSWVVIAVLGIALIATLAVPPIAGRLLTDGHLRHASEPFGFCYQPPSAADWQNQSRYGVRFGVDVLELSSPSAHVTVTDVQMIDPTPGFELLEVGLSPTPAMGVGAMGNEPWPVSDTRLLPLVQRLPAHLHWSPQAAAWVGVPADAGDWQLAVRVRVPAYVAQASLAGFRLTYKSGWLTRTVRTSDRITIGTTKCPIDR